MNTRVYWFDLGNWRTSTPIRSKGPATGIEVSGGLIVFPVLYVAQVMQARFHLLTSLLMFGHQ